MYRVPCSTPSDAVDGTGRRQAPKVRRRRLEIDRKPVLVGRVAGGGRREPPAAAEVIPVEAGLLRARSETTGGAGLIAVTGSPREPS